MMTGNMGHEVAEIGVRLVDAAYMAWLAAATESEQALHAWFNAARGQAATGYYTYRAALDREEAAARDLERLLQLAQPCRDTLVQRQEGVVT